MKIHAHPWSINSRKTFMTLAEKQQPADLVLVMIPKGEQKSPAHLAVYAESGLDAPQLASVRAALDAILAQQEPFPAVVMNRHWDIVASNAAAGRFFGFLFGDGPAPSPANVVRLMLHPGPAGSLRPHVANWTTVAEALIRRVHREAVGGTPDEKTQQLLTEVLAYPGVADAARRASRDSPQLPIIPISFRKEGRGFDFFSTVTTLGTPQDITAQELRIECFFPSNPETARAARALERAA